MKTLQQIAEDTAAEFSRQYAAAPVFWVDLIQEAVRVSLKDEVIHLAIQLIRDKYNPDIEGLTDEAVREWIARGKENIGEPSKEFKKTLTEKFEKEISGRLRKLTREDVDDRIAKQCRSFLREYRAKKKSAPTQAA